jgi:hypothetical protein
MKAGHELTAQPSLERVIVNGIKRIGQTAGRPAWSTRLAGWLPRRRDFLLSAAASVIVALLCLASCYLFLSQLAAYGW